MSKDLEQRIAAAASDYITKAFGPAVDLSKPNNVESRALKLLIETLTEHFPDPQSREPQGTIITECDCRVSADRHVRVLQWSLALQSLTPGGSEFADDPARCAAFVKEKIERQHQQIIELAKRLRDPQTPKTTPEYAASIYEQGGWLVAKCLWCEWQGTRWRTKRGSRLPNGRVAIEHALRDHVMAAHVEFRSAQIPVDAPADPSEQREKGK
jgi:hypothetical protein